MKLSGRYAIPSGSDQDWGFEFVLKNLLGQEIIMTQKRCSIVLEMCSKAKILR